MIEDGKRSLNLQKFIPVQQHFIVAMSGYFVVFYSLKQVLV